MLISARSSCAVFLLAWLTLLVAGCSDSSPQARLSAAHQHIARDDPQGALIILKGVVRDQPNHAPAQRLLGELYFQLGNFPLAARALDRTVALNDKDPQVFSLYVQALIQQKKYATALDVLATQQQTTNGNGQFAALSAIALTGLEKTGAAADALATVPASSQNHYLVLYARSVLQQATGNLNQSIDFAKQAITAAPENPVLHSYLGDLLLNQKLYEQAVNEFQAALNTSGESRVTAQNLAIKLKILQGHLAAEDIEQAKKILAELKSTASDHPATHYFSGLVAYQDQAFEKSETEALATLSAIPSHAPAQLLAGLASYELSKYEQANMYLERFLANRPDHQRARKKLAATLLHLNKPRDAHTEFKKIVGTLGDGEELQGILGSLEQSLAGRKPNRSALEEMLQRLDTADNQTDSAIATVQRLLSRRQFAETNHRLSKLLDEAPENIDYLNLAGASAAMQNRPEEAEKLFRRALVLDPAALDTTLNLGLILAANHQYAAATDLYKELLTKRPKATQLMLELAKLADRQQQKEEALSWINEAITINPSAVLPWQILINYHLRAGEYLQAKHAALEAQQLLDKEASIKLLLAQAEAELGNPDLAVEILASLLLDSPENGTYHLQLARYQLDAGQQQQALESFREANSLLPDGYVTTGQLAAIEWAMGNRRTAIELAEKYISKQPGDPRGYGLHANLLARGDNQSDAAKALARAASLAPTPEWTMRYVLALLEDNQTDTAFTTAESWLNENPQAHSFRYQLGNLYLARANIERANQHYTRLADQQVASSDTLNNLAWGLYQLNKPSALNYAEQAVAADAGNLSAVDTLAWILIDSNRDPQRGTELLSELKNLPADIYPTVRYHLAVGLERLGNHREAARILTTITSDQYQFADKHAASELLNDLRTPTTKNR